MKNIDTIEPVFQLSIEDEKILEKIDKKLNRLKIVERRRKKMRFKSRVKSIYSSLAIENSNVSYKAVKNVLEDKLTLGKKMEIEEIKNLNELYQHIHEFDWRKEEDFLRAYHILMQYFDNSGYRKHGEGIQKEETIIYQAPDSLLVPSLMKSLFDYLSNVEIHRIVLSSIFHYYFVSIHPFRDGNGRMARLWMMVMLIDYNPKFEYLPIEEEIHLNQNEYYEAIKSCHVNGNANVFISYMLKIIDKTINKVRRKQFLKSLKI